MQKFGSHRFGIGITVAVLATLVTWSCADDSTGPRSITGFFAVAPSFRSDAASIVDIAEARFRLIRNDESVAIDTVVTLSLDVDSVDVSLAVPLDDPEETFTLFVQLITPAGDTAFSAGPLTVTPSTAGDTDPPIIEVELEYTGTGADATDVQILTQGASVFSTEIVTLEATALDSVEEPIVGTPIAWRSLDTAVATVEAADTGVVRGGDQRGTARIVAALLTGPEDTITVRVQPLPTTIAADSGDAQTGSIGAMLAERLVALFTASDGLGVEGVSVVFTVASGGGSVSSTNVLTDSTGRAAVDFTLGLSAGAQTVTATSPRLPGETLTFTATAVATNPSNIGISAGDNQSAPAGSVLPIPPAVLVTDSAGNPVQTVLVTWTVLGGGGSVAPSTSLTDGAGIATAAWTLGASAGANLLQALINTSAGPQNVVFTATGTAGATGAISIVQGNNQTAAAGTTLPIQPTVLVTDSAANPVVGVEVVFAITAGGGIVSQDTVFSDTIGMAAVDWTIGTTAGANGLSATTPGISAVTFSATGVAGVPTVLAVVSGDSQSVDEGMPLANPLVVAVTDSFGNGVSGQSVTWTAIDGSVAPLSSTTDGSGQAQTTWTLGTNSQTQTATASSGALTPVVFSATAIFTNPTILLGLESGSDRIVVGGSDTLDITLTAPAPVGGLTVAVSSGNPTAITVETPGSFTIPQDGTTGRIGLDAVSGGTATVMATATGYDPGSVSVIASVQVLSLPTTLNVPFGGTASLPVQISTPAPVGGVAVSLVSDNPTAVGVVTPSVTIPEGQSTANGTVSGLFPGSATITGTTAAYGSAQSAVSTTANLDITINSTVINQSFSNTIVVELESGGTPIAAPAPGIAVTFTSRDPTCAVAISPVTVPTGLVDTVTVISYGGSATTPCSTIIEASSPNIGTDSLSVTVNPLPLISYAVETMGAGLQGFARATLGATNHGGVNAVVKSLDPTLAVVSPNASTPGADSVIVPVLNGGNRVDHYVQGIEGVADTGDVTVLFEVRAPGFASDTVAHIVRQPAMQLSGVSTGPTTLTPDDPFTVLIGVTNAGFTGFIEFQSIRAGGTAVTATVTTSDPAVARLVDSASTGASLPVQIAVLANQSPGSVASGGLAVEPLTAGTTTISADLPGFFTMPAASVTVTVTAPVISYSVETMGAGLQGFARATLGATDHGGVDAVVKSLDPTFAVVSPNASTPGTDSVIVPVVNGGNRIDHYVQGIEGVADTGDVTVLFEVRAPGFASDTVAHIVRQPAMQLSGVSTGPTSLTPDDPFTVLIGVTNAGFTGFIEFQSIRAGGTAVTATVTTSDPAVARLVDSASTGASLPVQIAVLANQSPGSVASGGLAVEPLTAGTTTISADLPGFFTMPAASVTVTVTAPVISYSVETMGAGLQGFARATLGATDHGGVDAVVKSLDPTLAVVSPDAVTPGIDSVIVPVLNGGNRIDHYVQGIEGVADTGDVTVLFEVRAPGFTPDTVAHIVRQPAMQLSGVNLSTTSLSIDDPFTVLIGVTNAGFTGFIEFQSIRAGGTAVTATVVSSVPGVAQLVDSSLTGGTLPVQIPVGSNQSPGSVATGGLAIEPLTSGTTTISATIPGFFTMLAASQVVTVTTPTISLSNRTVGAGLQLFSTASLGAPAPAGSNLVIKSSAPGIALVSPDGSTAGADSILIPLTTGATSRSYYIQGVEGQTGAVTFTATVAGYTDGTAVKDVVTPAVQITSINTTATAGGADDPFWVYVGIPNATLTAFLDFQAVRAGAPAPLTATLTSDNVSVGQLVTTLVAGGGDTVTVDIVSGQQNSPTSVAAGGVAHRPIAAGSVIIRPSITGFIVIPQPDGAVTVTISP